MQFAITATGLSKFAQDFDQICSQATFTATYVEVNIEYLSS